MTDRLAQLYPDHIAEIKARHDRVLAETDYDHVLIFAGAEHIVFLDDMPYPFKANPHFKSWVPVLKNPNCFVLYGGDRPILGYFQPVDYWHKPAEDPTGFWVDHFDIRSLATPADMKELLAGKNNIAFLGEWDDSFSDWGIAGRNPDGVMGRLHYDRAWKTEYEIECMREANASGVRGHRAAEKAFRAGSTEYDIHLEYLKATGHTEAELPYGNIIAINENAAVLHYQHQSKSNPADRRSFLIDAGTSFNGYASDITRTYSAGNGEFEAMIGAVDGLQQDLCAMVRPGLDYKTLQMETHRRIGGVLSEFGIVNLDEEEMVEKGVTAKFFPHGVGHYIGLQVHDVGGFMKDREGETIPKPEGQPYLRLTRTVEPSHVFTVEPGLYFIDSLLSELRQSEQGSAVDWDKVDTFRKYGGVRVEDDIVVTEDGHENLTRDQFAK